MALLLLILSFCLSLSAQTLNPGNALYVAGILKPAAAGGGGHNPPASPVFLETFEGAGYSLAGWTEHLNSGVLDEDETAVVGDGSQSLQVTTAGSTTFIDRSVTAAGEYWVFTQFRADNSDGEKSIVEYQDGVSAVQGKITITATGQLKATAGAATATTTDAVPDDAWVNVWTHYDNNNGANRICYVGWGLLADTTRPTSGNKFAQASTTTVATTVAIIAIGVGGTDFGTDVNLYYDYVLCDDAQIGDNP